VQLRGKSASAEGDHEHYIPEAQGTLKEALNNFIGNIEERH